MKVKVAVPVFKDKLTGAYRKQGETFDVSQERFNEIRKAGPFVEPVHTKASKPKPDATEVTEQSEEAPAEPEPDPEPSILETDSGLTFEPTERKPGH